MKCHLHEREDKIIGGTMFKSKIRNQIERQINDLQLYLENNYKDLAIQALKEAIQLVQTAYKEGKLKEKNYAQYSKTLEM